ncbi:MAG: branched-chain amino acid ABC transporter permease [Pyrodictiaceae archaeon]
MVTAADVLAALVYGIIQGALFGVVAIGLSLIWGVMKVVNLAHGELLVIGAYSAILLAKLYNADPAVSPFLDFLLGAILGLAIFYAILYKLVGKVEVVTLREEMSTLLAMFGLSIFLFKFLYLWTDMDPNLDLYEAVPEKGVFAHASSISFMGISVEATKLYVFAVSIIIAIIMHLFLTRTTLGLAIRAVTQDAVAVSLVGLNPARIKAIATLIGIGITLTSGGLVALYHGAGISPELSPLYAPLSFVIVVLGTPGNLWGSMLAGFIIGEAYNLVYALTGSLSLGLASAFAILVAVLVFRPEGLFGRR